MASSSSSIRLSSTDRSTGLLGLVLPVSPVARNFSSEVQNEVFKKTKSFSALTLRANVLHFFWRYDWIIAGRFVLEIDRDCRKIKNKCYKVVECDLLDWFWPLSVHGTEARTRQGPRELSKRVSPIEHVVIFPQTSFKRRRMPIEPRKIWEFSAQQLSGCALAVQ